MKVNKVLFRKILILLLFTVITVIAGIEFWQIRNLHDSFFPSDCLVKVGRLSDYNVFLKGTDCDAPVYFFDSGVEGGTLFVMSGTHPNESGAILSSYLLMENLKLEKGRVIVLPVANMSTSSTGLPGFAYPASYTIKTANGGRSFKVGSRLSSPLDQWPDPLVFIQYPSNTKLCYEDSRNLNRSYPGRANGRMVERVGAAIMDLIRNEHVDYAFDLHEASITYPTNNAFIVPEKTADLAFWSSMILAEEDVDFNVEISSENLRGFSHQEWGRDNETDPFLVEVPTPFIDRITGPMVDSLIVEGADEFLARMASKGFSTISYDNDGFSLDYRYGKHLSAISEVVSAGNSFHDEAR